MHTDDLALVADSPEELQAMINTVCTYAGKWRYSLNLGTSFVMVFRESPHSRTHARSSRNWYLRNEEIEADKVHHLGLLRMVSLSTISCTTERCTAGRSAFFALNSVGSRFGYIHPVTSHRLYSTLYRPIVLYGSELWSLTNTKLKSLSVPITKFNVRSKTFQRDA